MAAPVSGGNAGKDGGGGVPRPRSVSRAELVKLWEDVFDSVGDDDKAMELFMALLLRDARAERSREEEERSARAFEPWQPTPPAGLVLPPPPQQPRVGRTAVLGLRAPPHLLRPRNVQSTPPPPPPSSARGDV